MKLIVGLGNPGKEYTQTRHNIGFLALDQFAEKNKTGFDKKKFQAELGELNFKGSKLVLLKPQTFMNLSGQSVAAALHFYKIEPVNLIVLHDDIDLEPGVVRFREKGSSGGHNGLKSIIENIGSTEFARIKIGIGKPSQKEDVSRHVLDKFSKAEKPVLEQAINSALNKLEHWLGVY